MPHPNSLPPPLCAGMLDPDEKDTSGKAFAARCVFIVGPDKVSGQGRSKPLVLARPAPQPTLPLEPGRAGLSSASPTSSTPPQLPPSQQTLKLSLLYPSSTGRNFDEVAAAGRDLCLEMHCIGLAVHWHIPAAAVAPFSFALSQCLRPDSTTPCPFMRVPCACSCCACWTRSSWPPSCRSPRPPTGARARRRVGLLLLLLSENV